MKTGEGSEGSGISSPVSLLKWTVKLSRHARAEQLLKLKEEKMELVKKCMELEFRNNYLEDEMKELKEKVSCLEKEKRVLSVKERREEELVALKIALKKLELIKVSLEAEVNEYKRISDSLIEEVVCAEEEKKAVSDRETKTQERIVALSMEIEEMERNEREKYVQLLTENKDLECAKIRAENEAEVWKKRYEETEKRELALEEKTLVLLRQAKSTLESLGNVEGKENGSYEESGKTGENGTSRFQAKANGTHPAKRSEGVHVAGLLLLEPAPTGGIIVISDDEEGNEDTSKLKMSNGETSVSTDHTSVGTRLKKRLKVADIARV